jgi:hypothetical protein
MTSTKFVGLLIDTVVCLTLAKWETVSGQFGGYLTALARRPPFAVRLGSYIELLRYPAGVNANSQLTFSVNHLIRPVGPT